MIRVDRGRVVGRSAPATKPAEQQAPSSAATNLNTATAKELAAGIKGVGPATARDIVAHRKKAGPFDSLADCAERVGGVSLESLEASGAVV